MHQSHGMSYAEYSNNLDNLMKVERARELDHKASIQMVSDHQQKLNT
ncbi:hypothetical protein [Alteribacter aurantiacus]|nr:hypothetical protein [Alteribacter aurantiacus]